MVTIYMIFEPTKGDKRLLEMETIESFIEAIWRCEIYNKRNPKTYLIKVEDEYIVANEHFGHGVR